MAEWWDKKSQIPLDSNNFQEILNFYLFHCPVEIEKGTKKKGTLRYEKVSKQAATLRNQGWIGGYLNSLFAYMKHTHSGHLEYAHCTGNNVERKTYEIEGNSLLSDNHFEMIVVQERNDMNLTSAVFYYIRNAFAHGSFSVIGTGATTTYYLESAKGDDVKARIRLREQTLLKWIEDFKLSPNALKMALSEERRERRKQKRRKRAA